MHSTSNELKHPSCDVVLSLLEETPAAIRQRKARILLRKVDLVLKDEGIDAAIQALGQVRRKIPLNPVIRSWLAGYQKMLKAWHLGLMPEVVAEYKRYGFRRARMVACFHVGEIDQERNAALYRTCEQVLKQMSERFRWSISDVEQESLNMLLQEQPGMVSIETVNEDELEHGTKY